MEKRHSLDTNSDKDSPYGKILGPVSSVKGVGKVFERELQKRGVNTVYDLLYLLPRS